MAAVLFIYGGFSMDFILKQLNDLGFDTPLFLRSAVLLAIGSILLGSVGRFVFGKRSSLHCAVSSAIGILFVYAVTIVIYATGAELQNLIAPLPFVDISGQNLSIFIFAGAAFTDICSQVLDMVILAFLVNLLDGILPKGKNFFLWLLLRVLTVVGAMALHILCNWLIGLFLPQGLMQYAPMVLLALLAILLLVGCLKIVVGAVLTTVNPIIGILYTFFFANIVGKAVTKAALTAGILSGLVYLLNYIGVTTLSIAASVLVAYIPLVLALMIIWYVIGRLFDK